MAGVREAVAVQFWILTSLLKMFLLSMLAARAEKNRLTGFSEYEAA